MYRTIIVILSVSHVKLSVESSILEECICTRYSVLLSKKKTLLYVNLHFLKGKNTYCA